MTTDIFIRTYEKDLGWLVYALASIQKYVTGHRNIVITIPKGQEHHISHLTAETVIAVGDMDDGYLGQQLPRDELPEAVPERMKVVYIRGIAGHPLREELGRGVWKGSHSRPSLSKIAVLDKTL